jgi:hypothetical protein
MEIVVGVLAVAGAAILVAFSIPIDLAVNVESSAAHRVRVRLVWFFGLLNVNLSGRKPRRKRGAREGKKTPVRSAVFRRVKGALVTKGLLTAVARFLRRTLSAVKLQDFHLRVRFGLDDPADTGMLLAAAAPALGVLRRLTSGFSAEADFNQEVFQASGNMVVRIYPIRIMGASAIFLLSPATLRAAKAMLWS